MKKCTGCDAFKALEEFGQYADSHSGVIRQRSKCKECRAGDERARQQENRPRKRCSVCGGQLLGSARFDVCRRNPECKRISESRHNFSSSRRRRSYIPCAKCGNDWLRANRAEKLCGPCRETSFWCCGSGQEGSGHVADLATWASANTCRTCRLLRRAAERALAKGVPFALTRAYIDSIWPDVCPYLGIPLVHGTGKLTRSSPTLDRITPALGYVEGNVEVISYLANAMKRDATEEQLIRFARTVLERYAAKVEEVA